MKTFFNTPKHLKFSTPNTELDYKGDFFGPIFLYYGDASINLKLILLSQNLLSYRSKHSEFKNEMK